MAKAALKSRKRFGGALEPMTVARAWFAERPRQELVRLDQLEIVRSPLSAPVDHARMAVLSFFAEVLDEALPEHDPQETVFRLLVSVLEQTTVAESEMSAVDAAHLFFALDDAADGPAAGHWPLHGLRRSAGGGEASFNTLRRRLVLRGCIATEPQAGFRPTPGNWRSGCCGRRRRLLPAEPWPRRRGQDLRRFTLQALERHLERKLRTAEALATAGRADTNPTSAFDDAGIC